METVKDQIYMWIVFLGLTPEELDPTGGGGARRPRQSKTQNLQTSLQPQQTVTSVRSI